MNVRRKGKSLSLSASAVLGVGGEATVFDLGRGEVAKVWHTPSDERDKKLRALMGMALPPELVAPRELLQDAQGNVVGFTMLRLDAAFEPFATLSKRSTTASLLSVLACLVRLRVVLAALHRAGIVVGDLSDQNVMVSGEEIRLLDVDSVQITGFPCPVGTEATLDPSLYGIDLSRAPAFTPETDAYAFAVLAFRALLHVHPYGGVHPALGSLPQRAEARMSVFDPAVAYPHKIARPLATLPAALSAAFESIFTNGARPLLAERLFQGFADEAVPCTGCKLVFARSRGACPGCAVALPAPRPRSGQKLSAHVLIEARGALVAGAVTFAGLTVVSREVEGLVRYERHGGGIERRALGLGESAVVSAGGQVFVSENDGTLRIFGAGDVDPIVTSTELFEGRSVVAASGDRPVRICGGVALVGKAFKGNLVEHTALSTLPGQSWLDAGGHPEGVIMGFFRVFRAVRFFRVTEGRFLDLLPPPLLPDEVLEAAALETDGPRTLLVRHSRERGTPYTRLDLLDARGSVMTAHRSRRDEGGTREGLHGRLVQGGVVLHPTGLGIVREELRHGALGTCTVLTETEPFVSARSRLLRHPRGLISLEGNLATLLER